MGRVNSTETCCMPRGASEGRDAYPEISKSLSDKK